MFFRKNIIQNKTKYIFYIFFVFLLFFRLHNANVFNPYWGYDGGAHLDYIEKIYLENKLPDMQENYLAWHEPGFYYFYSYIGKLFNFIYPNEFSVIIKFLQVISSIISVFIVYLVYKTVQQFTKNKYAQLATVISFGLLSVFTETTNYLTNELLLAFFIILLFYSFITFSKKGWNLRRILIISILSGLALLTKLSALIFIFAILIWLIYRSVYTKKIKYLNYAFIFCVICILIYSPWAIYKQKNIGSFYSINVYEKNFANTENQNRELNPDFFYRLNPQIFNNPFWMTSSNSFWAIIFTDTFSDYYAISGNVDKNDLLSGESKILTGSGRFVINKKFSFSVLLLYSSVFFIFIFLGGTLGLFLQWIKRGFLPSINLFILIFIIGSFLALMYNVWSFPVLERGTLKTSFILSVWPLLMIVGWSWLANVLNKFKLNFLWAVFYFYILIWGSLSVYINWI
ncbi:MAG: glycosyltransferase family 39 protein [Patescibacteria group bacterium]